MEDPINTHERSEPRARQIRCELTPLEVQNAFASERQILLRAKEDDVSPLDEAGGNWINHGNRLVLILASF